MVSNGPEYDSIKQRLVASQTPPALSQKEVRRQTTHFAQDCDVSAQP